MAILAMWLALANGMWGTWEWASSGQGFECSCPCCFCFCHHRRGSSISQAVIDPGRMRDTWSRLSSHPKPGATPNPAWSKTANPHLIHGLVSQNHFTRLAQLPWLLFHAFQFWGGLLAVLLRHWWANMTGNYDMIWELQGGKRHLVLWSWEGM